MTPYGFLLRAAFVVGALAVVPACSTDSSGDPFSARGDREQLVQLLMRWDRGEVPNLESVSSLPEADNAVDLAAVRAVVERLAPDGITNFTYNPDRGTLTVNTTEREFSEGPDTTRDEAITASVAEVSLAIGVSPETVLLTPSMLQAAGGDVDGEAEVRDVARKVYGERRVGGLGVSGERLTATFELDGSLVSLNASWRRFGYATSELTVDGIGTRDDVMAAVARAMLASDIVVRDTVSAIDVGTFYVPVAADDGSGIWRLRLAAYAGLRDDDGNGLGSEGKIPHYEFLLTTGERLGNDAAPDGG